jgi:hypothetical protein
MSSVMFSPVLGSGENLENIIEADHLIIFYYYTFSQIHNTIFAGGINIGFVADEANILTNQLLS